MPANSRDQQLIELKDTITNLNKLIATLQQTLEESNRREKVLREQIEYLNKKLFGHSSERSHDVPGQLSFLDGTEPETYSDQDDVMEPDPEPVIPRSRKKKSTKTEKYKGLPFEKRYEDVPEEERICPSCGTAMEVIGETLVRRDIEFIPAKMKVIEVYSKNYGCPRCRVDSDRSVIKKGIDYHPHLIHGMATESTLAWIMYQKYANSMPLYRQENDFKIYGAEISRATMAGWLIKNAEDFFRPLYDHFHRLLIPMPFAMADETPVQVLKEPDRRPETQSYMWVFRTGEYYEKPFVLYKYSETRAGDTAKDFLKGFSGYLMCDGYSGYNKVPEARRTACWAHVRRYLLDAIPKGKKNDYSEPAVQGYLYVEKLFTIEKTIHSKTSNPEVIRKKRLEKERPVLDAFWKWLDSQHPIRRSRLDKAVTYINNRRPYLETYLENGCCSFSNNSSERSCKAFVVGRKNWLFSDTPEGADTSALIYSIVETAKANGVNIYHYLKYLLEKTPSDKMSDEDLESLSPWNPDVKNEISRRVAESNDLIPADE